MKNMENLKEMIALRLGVELEDITIREVLKNNGVKYTGLAVNERAANMNVAVTINIDEILDVWERTGRTAWAVEKIAEMYEEAKANDHGIGNFELTKEYALENAFIQVIGYERNKEMLNDVPYDRIADLAVIARVKCYANEEGIGSARVSDGMLMMLGLKKDELFRKAYENTLKDNEFIFMSMMDMMSKQFGMTVEEEEPDPAGMFVFTTKRNINGAQVLAYEDKIEDAIRKMGAEKAYILPSSIHEVLLVNARYHDVRDLKTIVTSVNHESGIIEDEDYLSDSVYEFDLKTKELRVAA